MESSRAYDSPTSPGPNAPSAPTRATPDRRDTRSPRALWAGRVLSGLALLFLAFDGSAKVLGLEPAVRATTELGYPASALLGIGLVELGCVLLSAIPRTAVLGAVLLTGYLGGAVATHVRVESPLLSHTLFPIHIAALLWAGLWLRDARVRALIIAPPSG